MEKPVVIVGLGQMGGVFARGFLKIGHPVHPVLRYMSIQTISNELADPALVLVAVAKPDLEAVLQEIPGHWKGQVGLLQNELLPRDWQEQGISDPTVIVVRFEKKFRKPVKPLFASPIYGPRADLVAKSLEALEIPVKILDNEEELVSALVMKNLYILTTNITGLVGADTIGGLLEQDRALTEAVFEDVLGLQEALTGMRFEKGSMWRELTEIFQEEPGQASRGRSAPQRLHRAIAEADRIGVTVKTLKRISEEISTS
jgi:ketopantoate reductase